MPSKKERLELAVTFVTKGITVGVRPASIEFVDHQPALAQASVTTEGHIRLEPGASFYVNVPDFSIGRSVTNDLFVDSAKISRSHVRLTACEDETYTVTDLGSANGTGLNGRRLDKNETAHLRSTGELQLAGVFHLKFIDAGATDVTPESVTVYGITLSHADRRVQFAGGAAAEDVRLSTSEYHFLKLLMETYPEPVSHRDLAYAIWGWEPDNAEDEKRVRDALFNIVKRLRERLEVLDSGHEYIETVRKWGEREGGYRFNKQ